MLVKMKCERANNSKNLFISTKLVTHRTLVKVWNLRNWLFTKIMTKNTLKWVK